MKYVFLIWVTIGWFQCHPTEPIHREALVTRHNVVIEEVDTLGALTVGNGEFAFTVDVTGLQSFPEEYEHGIPLATQSQWGWHSMPNPEHLRYEETLDTFTTCGGKAVTYATQGGSGRKGSAVNWFRSNPHRLHLGLIGLELIRSDGTVAHLSDLHDIHQVLDLWNGIITSHFTLEDSPVEVQTIVLPDADQVAFQVNSPLCRSGRIKARLQFPYAKACHVCPGYDWDHPEDHTSQWHEVSANQATILRTLDSTHYTVQLAWHAGKAEQTADHEFVIQPSPGSDRFEATVQYSEQSLAPVASVFEKARKMTGAAWHLFWQLGGAVDFADCTDNRAFELERRIILSQYLTRIQCAGSIPSQETGLTGNSWYGKSHLEMHWWHGVHFALWGRRELLEKSMNWYDEIGDRAHGIAERQGYDGVRWPKMTGPDGISSPSSVGEFLIWQQPHPIYLAELMYRSHPERATLEKYQKLVFETADFIASFAYQSSEDSLYHLCRPLIPAQEIFPALETDDPSFELAYWYWALQIAQQWRARLQMPKDVRWEDVIRRLAPLPQLDGNYLPTATCLDAYSNRDRRRDHPIVTGILGVLPLTDLVDPPTMERTYQEVKRDWEWETTWGWDFPMLAMAAARLGHPEDAIDWLLKDTQKNTYLVNGHNYQDQRLKIYLPGNGGLLAAVAMMTAGWDGNSERLPGFPKDGKWQVRWEGLEQMP